MSEFNPENERFDKFEDGVAENAETPVEPTAAPEQTAAPKEEIKEEVKEEVKEEIKEEPARDGEYSFTYRRADEPRRSSSGPAPYGAPQYHAPYSGGYYHEAPRAEGSYNAPYGATYDPNPYGAQYAGGNRQYNAPYGAYHAQPQPQPQPQPKREKKKSSSNSKFAVLAAILCVCTVILAAGAGYLGAWFYRKSRGGVEAETAVMYRSVETKSDAEAGSLSEVYNAVADSVVEIETEYVTTGYFSFGQYVTKGAGSGVIISDNGYIVTNNHVVSDTDNGNTLADKITVRLHNGTEYQASVIGRDEDADIAVIKIEASNLTAAVWGDSNSLVVGEQIFLVGNPLGKLGGTVTTGIISASDREITIDNTKMNLIQTDAAINPGNSGGGMFNMNGELVGIVNAKSAGTAIEGLGFAIPSADAKSVVEQLLEYGYVRGKIYTGITFYEANTGGWFSSGSSTVLYVYSCEEGYNDDVLKYGDQIVSVEGTAVTTKAEVKSILSKHEVGDKVSMTIIRNNKTVDVEIELFEYNPNKNGVTFTD